MYEIRERRRARYLCVEGKILAIAQYVIKYDYRGNTKGNITKNQLTKMFLLLSTPFMAFY
jgi:hypothetical protein